MRLSAERAVIAAVLLVAAAGVASAGFGEPPAAQRRDRPILPPPSVAAEDALPPATDGAPRATSGNDGEAAGYDAVGYASWYGDEMGKGRTASGQTFNSRAISAAHPTLPLGSFAEVTALDTGKTILVMVTDRGPNGPARIVDLSHGAAQQLGIERAGIAAVRVRQVDPAATDQAALRDGRMAAPILDAPPVLLAALRKRMPGRGKAATVPPARAVAVARTALPAPIRLIPPAPTRADAAPGWFVQVIATSSRTKADDLARTLGAIVVPAGAIYRVRIGPFGDAENAERARDDAARRGYGDARIVHE